MPHAQISEHCGLVLGDCGVVDCSDLGELVWVDEVERRVSDELSRLESCEADAINTKSNWVDRALWWRKA